MQHTVSHESSRDWPAALKLSAARDALAQAIYYARAQAYGLGAPHWDGLTPPDRQHYREIAAVTLAYVKPSPVQPVNYFAVAVDITRQAVTGLRPTHGPVIGCIAPIDDEVA